MLGISLAWVPPPIAMGVSFRPGLLYKLGSESLSMVSLQNVTETYADGYNNH
jgi:hypothetical protein